MRFEIASAFVMGVLLPFLATCLGFCRQGFTLSFADVRGDLQDYLSGALLLLAGWFSVRLRSFAPAFIILAWAYFSSMMVDSSWGQVDDTLRGEIEPYNTAIIVSKLAILMLGLVSLTLSVRRIGVRTGMR